MEKTRERREDGGEDVMQRVEWGLEESRAMTACAV